MNTGLVRSVKAQKSPEEGKLMVRGKKESSSAPNFDVAHVVPFCVLELAFLQQATTKEMSSNFPNTTCSF